MYISTVKKIHFLLVCILMLVTSASVFADCTKFPCQKPHRFTNHEFVKGSYILDELIFTNVPKDLKLHMSDKNLKIVNFPIAEHIKNKRFSFKQGQKPLEGDLYLDPKSIITIKDNKGNVLLVTRFKNTPKYVDAITFYLFNIHNTKDYGTRTILDVDKFEKFLTQTWEYDNLAGKPKKTKIAGIGFDEESRPDIGSIKLAFEFDPATFTKGGLAVAYEKRIETKNQDIGQYIPPISPNLPRIPVTQEDYNYQLKDITEWQKDAPSLEGGYALGKIGDVLPKDRVTYAELYKDGIIKTEPIAESDFNSVKKLSE